MRVHLLGNGASPALCAQDLRSRGRLRDDTVVESSQRAGGAQRQGHPPEERPRGGLPPHHASQPDEPGELESAIRRKILAAGVYRMESEVIEGVVPTWTELRSYAARSAPDSSAEDSAFASADSSAGDAGRIAGSTRVTPNATISWRSLTISPRLSSAYGSPHPRGPEGQPATSGRPSAHPSALHAAGTASRRVPPPERTDVARRSPRGRPPPHRRHGPSPP